MNRRQLLKGTGVAAMASAVGYASPVAAGLPRKFKIIVTGGHPGDPEYGCGGTVARLVAAGHDVMLLYLNDGAWETSAEIRIAEAKKACEILKARPAWAGQANGHAIVDDAHYEAFHRIVAAENPDAVFSQWFIDNHPDHRAIANLTYEAWNRMKRRFALYYYEVSNGEDTMQFNAPTHYVDITGVLDTKKAACYAHASQNPDFFYTLQDTVAAFRGLTSGYKRAEAFIMQTGAQIDVLGITGLLSGN
ncbi:MAG TPA: PIG-L deacetylase family protein [Terracidiphilus sp.]|jgi:LmbE family N-acetylglucosaminyl deacetylase|nr:PIG-L deacetylase family protein [Terracidiphilus sp.]